ncbi:MAG TPA: hypothetical protein VJW73_15165 [Gemmatimonadaceae bacterium]|nr:hypothetical protein [Gemmatimonadaceae bacterium]
MRSIFSPTETETAPRLISPPKPPPPPPSPEEPMLDAEKQEQSKNGRVDVAEQVGVMLRDLFESADTFVISNAGVQAIIDGLLRRYRASESPVLREKLLVHWKQDVPRLRAALVEAAKDDPLVLDTGQEVSLVTTQKAEALLDRFCPQTPYLPDTRGARNVR